MRILHIVFNQVDRGTYWRALYFGRSLAARGHQVTLVATSARARARISERMLHGVQLVEMPDLLPGALRSGWDVWAVARRLMWLRGRRFDIVHAFEARPVVVYPALMAQRTGAKLIMDWCDWFGRGGSVEERPSAAQRAVLRHVETYYEEHYRTRADGTTVINRFLGERAAALGVGRQSILLLRNGAETSAPLMARTAARRAAGLPERGPILAHLGGSYRRDAELMARAFEQVRRAHTETRLLLVDYFNRDIEGMLGSEEGIIRTGPLPAEKIPIYLSAADLGWLPLRDTGANRGRWPQKLSGYMAAGRPTVTTRVGDLPEVVERYGMGVATGDTADEFAAATLALLADEGRRAEMGRAARQAAEGDFRWEKLAEVLEAHYRWALGI